MVRRLMVIIAALMLAPSLLGKGPTATLLGYRRSSSASIAPGYWHANFSKAKSYAESKGIPFIAVWSQGDACGHCILFESSVNSSYFREWMKKSGCVFFFTYTGESAGKEGGTACNWCTKGKGGTFPFVRTYWKKGGVDVATQGDNIDGLKSGTDGGKKAVAYFKKKLAKFKGVAAPVIPYTVQFDPCAEGVTGTMPTVSAKVGTSFTLPANCFVRKEHTFNGWAKTAGGALAYKNKASAKNLTSVSNGVATLYARWYRSTFKTYYVGLSCTITMQSSLKNWTTSTKIPGMKWTKSKYRWTGKPTKAGTYKVTYKKGSKKATRSIVIAKDAVLLDDESISGRVWARGEDVSFPISAYSNVGQPKSVAVSGLPVGLTYDPASGTVSGISSKAGTFKATITIVSAAGQKLSRTIDVIIGVPEICVGTFSGFVGFLNTERLDALALNNRGTFRLSAPASASLSAKVVTAKGTYSFASVGWLLNGDGTYTADMVSTTGKDHLLVTIDENLPPDKSIANIGVFTPSYGTAYEVWAQRAPFARDAEGRYVDPVMEATMPTLVGKWYFKAYAVGSEWMLEYATSKTASVTVTVDSDGLTKMAGKIGSYKVSASSSLFVFAGDVDTGFVRADFPVPVTVGKTKKTLDIWTNLWFDKSNSHFNARGEGIGGASVENFQ